MLNPEWPAMNEMPGNKARDVVIGLTMFVFVLFAALSAASHGLSVPYFIAFVLIIGSLPWLGYNALAYLLGWERSRLFDLFYFWIDTLINVLPW